MVDSEQFYDGVRDIPTAVATLDAVPVGESGVLSVLLDTSIHQVPNRAYLLFFRDAARSVRVAVQGDNPEQLQAFDSAVDQVENFLLHRFAPRNPGLAVYVSEHPRMFLSVPMPRRPSQDVVWDDEPLRTPLIAVMDDFERVAVALVDKREARLATLYLGAFDEYLTLSSETVGKHAPGDWPRRTRSTPVRMHRRGSGRADTIAWSGMAQAAQQRRHDVFATRHVRRVAEALSEMLREQPFDRLFLAGSEEAVVMLRDNLPRPLAARYAGFFALPLQSSDSELRDATLTAAAEAERNEEVEIVKRLLDAVGMQRGVVGQDDCLRAAREGRVAKLILARPDQAYEGRGESTEQVVAITLNQAGSIEFVSGSASTLLAEYGGIGAFTRY